MGIFMKTKTQKQCIRLGEKLASNPDLLNAAKPNKARNYLVLNPLLKKGGVHNKDNPAFNRKKQRRQNKAQLGKTDWLKD